MNKKEPMSDPTPSKVCGVIFGIGSAIEIRKNSVVSVCSKSVFDSNMQQVAHGPLDKRLGLSYKSRPNPDSDLGKCGTCKEEWLTCAGHFGHLDLFRPVFHIGFINQILGVLNIICKECAGLLLDPQYIEKIRMKLKRGISFVEKKQLFKAMIVAAKKIHICPHCSAKSGVLKIFGRFKIVYEPLRYVKDDDPVAVNMKKELDAAMVTNKWLESFRGGPDLQFINPVTALELFRQISESDAQVLMLREPNDNDMYSNHPKDMILTKLPVPPSCIRPTVQSDLKASTNEDDITVLFCKIIEMNNVLAEGLSRGTYASAKMQEGWDILQMRVSLLFDGELKNVPPNVATEQYRGFVQRLKGKQGRFRQNLEGKRCNYTARSVISPDPNLKIDQVGVPRLMAQTLTFPEKVNSHNVKWLSKLVTNGSNYPGATKISPKSAGVPEISLTVLSDEKRLHQAGKLRNGDTVYRHLRDGDIVLFNRQPSLHRMSIMAHKAKVLEGRTLRFNECVCTPYNADFDGDEMNLHLPQTHEARVEAAVLMDVKKNLLTPRNGEILIALTQDFITGAYLLSRKDCFLNRNKAQQLIAQILVEEDRTLKFEMPVPTIMKPFPLWTGKQILSFIFTHYQNEDVEGGLVKFNLRAPGKLYERDRRLFEMCPSDSYLLIKNSEILAGTIEKGTVGTGSRNNVFLEMTRLYNPAVAAKAMWRIGRVSSYYLMTTGFSIGIGDVTPSARLLTTKAKLLKDGFEKCDEILKKLATGTLEVMPGRTPEETSEGDILQTLSRIRDDLGKECIKELPRNNAPLIMALCGSKGSNINISQMVVCVGQQALNGKRVPNGFDERSLPHFKKKSLDPSSRGFVASSFYSGLHPPEFIFHAMGGREGLVDTAVKTAETGYIQRRLMKCLEDIVIEYDGSARTSSKDLIQIRYGGDGFDPVKMETEEFPIDLEKSLERSCCLNGDSRGKRLTGEEMTAIANEVLRTPVYNILAEQTIDWEVEHEKKPRHPNQGHWDTGRRPLKRSDYKKYILKFLEKRGEKMEALWAKMGLDPKKQNKWTPAERSLDCVTEKQLRHFLELIPPSFQLAMIEPGEPVGAICGQSIGEPATQMTLKTFHFAGVASMNISQGVPRLQEVMNNAKAIATPLITAKLSDPYDERAARKVKAMIEKTVLGDVACEIDIIHCAKGVFVKIFLDLARIHLLQLRCNVDTIAESIRTSKILKSAKLEAGDHISINDNHTIEIDISHTKLRGGPDAAAAYLRNNLTFIHICGLAKIDRCVISKEKGKMEILAEGLGMRDVLAISGVNGLLSTSNHIDEVYQTLGIEAARTKIIQEITSTVKGHGITIDNRHIMLLADNMTCTGVVEGTTRYGLQKMKNSVFLLASFEQTAKHLFDAAYFGITDDISGVSENIVFGTNVPLGTNKFDLLYPPVKNMILDRLAKSP